MLRDAQWQQLQTALKRDWRHLKRHRHVVLHLPSLPLCSWWQQHQGKPAGGNPAGQAPHQLWRLLGSVQDMATAHDVHQHLHNAGGTMVDDQQHTLCTDVAPGVPLGGVQCRSNTLGQSVGSTAVLGGRQVLVVAGPVGTRVTEYWMQLMARMSGVDSTMLGRLVASPLAGHAGIVVTQLLASNLLCVGC